MKKALYIILSICMILSLTACGGNSASETTAPQTTESTAETTEADGETPETDEDQNDTEDSDASVESVAISITHELGTTELMTNPERIVVFDFGTLDILDFAGIDIIGFGKGGSMPDHLAKYDSDAYTVAGSLHEPDFEAVFELEPDLILISARASTAYDELSEIAPTVYLPMPTSDYIETLEENIETISKIFPTKKSMLSAELEGIKNDVESIKETVTANGSSALMLMVNEGNLSVFGYGSRFALLYNDFGFKLIDESIEESTHGQSASFEYVAEKNPEFIFVVDRSAATGSDAADNAGSVLDNDLINQTEAAQNNNIIYLDAVNWYVASGGITSTNTMVAEIAAAVE